MSYGIASYGETSYGEEAGGPSGPIVETVADTVTFTGDQTTDQTLANEVSDTVTLTGILASGEFWYYSLAEGLTFGDLNELSQGYVIQENLGISTTFTKNVVAVMSVAEHMTLEDVGAIVFDALSADTVTFTDAQAYNNAVHVAEQMYLHGVHETHLAAMANVAETLAFLAEGGVVASANGEDTVTLTAAILGNLLAFELHQDGVILTDADTHTLNLRLEYDENVGLSDDLDLSQQLNVLLDEGLEFSAVLRLGTDVYSAWLMNTASKGVSRYENFPFNSFAELTDGYYGAADDGIYLMQGSDDDGTNIDASIKTGLYDFGERKSKRIHDVFLGVMTDGALVLKVTADEQGARTEYWYNVVEHGSPDNHRAKVGKGLRGVYWGFELVNVDGADVNLDNLQLYPLTLTRRV